MGKQLQRSPLGKVSAVWGSLLRLALEKSLGLMPDRVLGRRLIFGGHCSHVWPNLPSS